uniref:Uncharacterized protein n=1 Tax=Aegilops tauschii subsp. strangulata TaxID=200361 RepID=A0A453AZU4_AEGTS
PSKQALRLPLLASCSKPTSLHQEKKKAPSRPNAALKISSSPVP